MAKISKLFKTFLGVDVNAEDEDNDEFIETLKTSWENRNKSLKNEGDGKGKKSIQKKVNDFAKTLGIDITDEEAEDAEKVLKKIEAKAKESVKPSEEEPSEMAIKNSRVFKDYESSVAIREAAKQKEYETKIAELTEEISFTGVRSMALEALPNTGYILPKDKVRSENLKSQYLNEFKGITVKVDEKGIKTFYKGGERLENEAGKALTEVEIAERAAAKWLIPADEAEQESKDAPKGKQPGQGGNNDLNPKTEAEFNEIISRPGISLADRQTAKNNFLKNQN